MPGNWIDTMFQDIVYGWRILWRRPALFFSAVLLIALTTGATVALTGLADRVLLRPMPVSAPERLVQVVRNATAGGFSQESFPATLCDRLHEAGSQPPSINEDSGTVTAAIKPSNGDRPPTPLVHFWKAGAGHSLESAEEWLPIIGNNVFLPNATR